MNTYDDKTQENKSQSLSNAFSQKQIGGKSTFHWGKILGKQKGINTYEIDVVALNDSSKEIMFVECKWQTLTANNTRQICDGLKEKSKYVYWKNEKRQEYFAVVAKKIENKSELRDDGMIVFDLDDISA